MAKVTFRQANRRYRAIFIPLMVLYAILCFGTPALLEQTPHPPIWMRAGVALLNAAPIALVFAIMWRYLRETDEYTRVQQTTSLAAAGMIAAGIAAVWGFLELYNVVPSLWTFLLAPVFFGSWGLVHWWRTWRNQADT